MKELSRSELKQIMGGDNCGSTCTQDSDCPTGEKCCPTTDGSATKVCTLPGPDGNCPSSVGGCNTKCYVNGSPLGCYWSPFDSGCICLYRGVPCI